MTTGQEPYLKAIWVDWLVPWYDLVARMIMRERAIKRRVIEAAGLASGGRLLDVGCGTGTLVILAKQAYPSAEVTGLDGDPVILDRARRKALAAGVDIRLDEGMAYALPYADASFDAVVSTLTFHHLAPSQGEGALREAARVLRPGGRLVIADFAPPHNRLMKLARLPLQLLAGVHLVRKAHTPAVRPARDANGTNQHAVEAHDGPNGPHGGAGHERQHAHTLAASGWVKAAPPEYFMTLVGTLGLHTLTRPHARDGAHQRAHAMHTG